MENIDNTELGNEVVISGISGMYPKSDNVQQFMENLYKKIDMVIPIYREYSHLEQPKYYGKLSKLDKFDAQFFKVTYNQAMSMDPMCRKLMEHAYSAIYDSGINPLSINGMKTGVFVGTSYFDTAKIYIYDINKKKNSFFISGSSKTMLSNRVSYWLDAKAPSYSLDQACTSFMTCLEIAYRSIVRGDCENALVEGCNLCLEPLLTKQLRHAGFLTLDGKTKCFDKKCDGYVRSEAIGVVFLQKAKDARRIYAEVIHAKMSYQLKPDNELTLALDVKSIVDFLKEFYSEAKVSPDEIEYVEANASGLPNADFAEMEAISLFFSKNNPTKIGSVKSNMGHSEGASGFCALTKLCLAYHTGKLAANLHFEECDERTRSLCKDRIQVLREETAFQRKYTAINSFSHTGVYGHVLLKGHYKKKDEEKYKSDLPQLLNVSGRNENNIQALFTNLQKNCLDAEQIGLCRAIYQVNTPGHTYRGSIIMDSNLQKETIVLSKSIEYYDGKQKPVCFIYSGMGSQWPGMGGKLLSIPVFNSAIKRCDQVLKPFGVDLIHILCETDDTLLTNILNSFIGITAIQIGLTDVLKTIGITPDFIIGHSFGELACAYADECLSLEETILVAYHRGLIAIQTVFIHGSMAAVGMGYKEIKSICPDSIDIACHNSPTSCSISGPSEVVKTFINHLVTQKYFVKEVACNNIAFHSRYIQHAGPVLNNKLKAIIKHPKIRSAKWISSSVLKSQWNNDEAKFSSSEYHTNNLLNPVYFEEAIKLLPEEAILIEIAPHGLLTPILKRSMVNSTTIPLTKRRHPNSVQFFLEAIGNLYQVGLNPKIETLYPKMEYPVSTETPMLSHLVEWEHNENWPVPGRNEAKKIFTIAREFNISALDEDYAYLSGYNRNGILVLPEMFFLVLTWQTFAISRRMKFENVSITLEKVKFYKDVTINVNVPFTIHVSISKGSHKFQVSHNETQIVDGYINVLEDTNDSETIITNCQTFNEHNLLKLDDIYRLLFIKGYYYKETLKCFQSYEMTHKKAKILKTQEWTTFLDALMLFNVLPRNHTGISMPNYIEKITIDTVKHKKAVRINNNGSKFYDVDMIDNQDVTKCGGVLIEKVYFSDLPLKQEIPDCIYGKQYCTYFPDHPMQLKTALMIQLQIVKENTVNKVIYVTEIRALSNLFEQNLKEAVNCLQYINFDFNTLQNVNLQHDTNNDIILIKTSNILLGSNLFKDWEYLSSIYSIINEMTFFLSLEDNNELTCHVKYSIVSIIPINNNYKLMLYKKLCKSADKSAKKVTCEQNFFLSCSYDNRQQSPNIFEPNHKDYYKNKGNHPKSKSFAKTGLTFIEDNKSNNMIKLNKEMHKQQIDKNLKGNLLKKNQCGGLHYLPTVIKTTQENMKLTILEIGNLDTLSWIDQSAPEFPANIIKVQYAGLSMHDYNRAVKNGTNDIEPYFGMDFSGIDSKGNRVMGLLPEGSITSFIESDSALLWPVPSFWRLDEAATVILPYINAYYALFFNRFYMKFGTIYINDGAGALSIALITISLSMNCNVFISVINAEKKSFLLKLFPCLQEESISFSDVKAFYHVVAEKTDNRMCDVVVNFATGTHRNAILIFGGRNSVTLEINTYDINLHESFGMSNLKAERSFKIINVTNIFKPENLRIRQILRHLIAEGITSGTVKPIPNIILSPDEVNNGLKLLSRSQNRGKILINMNNVINNQNYNVLPRVQFNCQASYIVVCANPEITLGILEWLITRGSRKFLIFGHNNLSQIILYKQQSWKKLGVVVKIFDSVNKTSDDCANALDTATEIGPVEGIFIYNNNDENIFEMPHNEDLASQAVLTISNFDVLSRKICNNLCYFIVIYNDTGHLDGENVLLGIKRICQERKDNGYTAMVYKTTINTLLSLQNDSISLLSITAALNGLEMAIRSDCTEVIAYNKGKRNDWSNNILYTKLALVLGVQNLEQICESVIIGDLINNVNILEEIRTIIKNEYQLSYTVQELQKMSIGSLEELQNSKNVKSKYKDGVGAFISTIEDEFRVLTADYFKLLPTQVSSTIEDGLMFEPNHKYMILLPGLDGDHGVFETFCKRLKIRVISIEYETVTSNDSFKQMAINILKNLKKRLNILSNFYILGYSFGMNVAMELVALLENEGYKGVLFALDSSPEALKDQFDSHVGQVTLPELQNIVLGKIYSIMMRTNENLLHEQFEQIDTWEEKINHLIINVKHKVTYSHEYIRRLIQTLYTRLVLLRDYKPHLFVYSQIVLIKGSIHLNSKELEEDYGLSKYSKQPVEIFDIESDRAMVPHNLQICDIINKKLDPNIIKEYTECNTCETYYA